MGDESTQSICAIFDTREAADRAVEHLVQEFGVPRADIFVEARKNENSAGTQASGGDVARDPAEGSALDPALTGHIAVSVDVGPQRLAQAERVFDEIGAIEIQKR